MTSLAETENVEPLILVNFMYPATDDNPRIEGFRFFKLKDYDKFLVECTRSFIDESDQYIYWGPEDPNYINLETIENYLSYILTKEVTFDAYRNICDALELLPVDWSFWSNRPNYEILETYGIFMTPIGVW